MSPPETNSPVSAPHQPNGRFHRWVTLAWACARALLLVFAMAFVTFVAFVAVAKRYSICPEAYVAKVYYGRFCTSFWWSLGNHTVVALLLALIAMAIPRLGRVLRLVLVNVPLVALLMTLAGLCRAALDTSGVEGAESIFLDWKDDIYLAWGLVLGGIAALQYVAWRRDGKPAGGATSAKP